MSICQVSASVIIAVVPLAKASHMAKLRVSIGDDYPRGDGYRDIQRKKWGPLL